MGKELKDMCTLSKDILRAYLYRQRVQFKPESLQKLHLTVLYFHSPAPWRK